MTSHSPTAAAGDAAAEPLLGAAAFGKQAAQYGRALPFSEAVASLDELPTEYADALRPVLAEAGTPLRGLILSPAFATVGRSSPENVLALTGDRWFLLRKLPQGLNLQSAPYAETALVELEMILLGGRLRVETRCGEANCTIGFNMVSIALFRQAAFLILAGADSAPARQTAAQAVDTRQLSFKFQTALAEQLPPGHTLQSITAWERMLRPFAWLFFRKPAAPSGVLAVTDRALCILTDPADGKGKQEKGKAPHGKVVVYLPRRAELQVRHDAATKPGQEDSVLFALPSRPQLHTLRLPTGTAIGAALAAR